MATRQPLAERFWSKVDRRGDGECWPWNGWTDRDGYGSVSRDGKHRLAHRISWELANGRPPHDCVCHSCDNPRCVNPSHLWVGTHSQNMQDAWTKGRRKAAGRALPRTHCAKGHEFTLENTYQPPNAGRQCRACNRVIQRNRKR